MTERQATTEAFHGVQTAYTNSKLTSLQWQAYEVLWHHGPLAQKDLNDKAKTYYGDAPRPMWAAQLKKLVSMGLVRLSGTVWDVTDVAIPGEVSVPKKPSKKKFKKGVDDIEMALIKAEHLGLGSVDAHSVLAWLQSKT